MIRLMTANDLDGVMIIQSSAYESPLHEDVRVFKNRIALFPEGCWVFEDNNEVGAYIFSHPSCQGKPPTLNDEIVLPEYPDCYYIHDLAVLGAYRGYGIGENLINTIRNVAAGLKLFRFELVAVQRSLKFWSKHGFAQVMNQQLESKLQTYSPDACYMVCESEEGGG